MNEITPEQVKARMNEGETLTLIDVREHEEVAAGIIPGALHIPMNDIPSRIDDISKTDEVIFICRSGARSGRVCEYLESRGFTGVKNMIGGMLEWNELE